MLSTHLGRISEWSTTSPFFFLRVVLSRFNPEIELFTLQSNNHFTFLLNKLDFLPASYREIWVVFFIAALF